jgi:hypothetical protein
VQWWLDDHCHADYALALLPEVGRFAAGAIELLFRGRLDVQVKDEQLEVRIAELGLGAGVAAIYADDERGQRRRIGEQKIGGADEGELILSVARPGERHVAALFKGVDKHGEPVVVARELDLAGK